MQIEFNGLASFTLTAKNLQGEVHVVTDPYDNAVGLRFPRTLEADIVTVSHDAPVANNVDSVGGEPFVVDVPGEYEVGEVFVYGVPAPLKDGTAHSIMRFESEGMNIVHLGALDRPLTDDEMKQFGDVDVLMVPIGGGSVLDPEAAASVVQAIQPRVVIPMFYGDTKLNIKEASAKKFTKIVGGFVEETSKLKITRAQLPEENMNIVVLT